MSAVERAAELIARDRRNGWGPYSTAKALAEAGLLLTNEDRAVLEAAEAWYLHACAATRSVWSLSIPATRLPGMAIFPTRQSVAHAECKCLTRRCNMR